MVFMWMYFSSGSQTTDLTVVRRTANDWVFLAYSASQKKQYYKHCSNKHACNYLITAHVTDVSVRLSVTAATLAQKDHKWEQCRCSEFTPYNFIAGSTWARRFIALLKVHSNYIADDENKAFKYWIFISEHPGRWNRSTILFWMCIMKRIASN